jgi:hypothetical protein
MNKIYMRRGVITVIFIHVFTVVMRSKEKWNVSGSEGHPKFLRCSGGEC